MLDVDKSFDSLDAYDFPPQVQAVEVDGRASSILNAAVREDNIFLVSLRNHCGNWVQEVHSVAAARSAFLAQAQFAVQNVVIKLGCFVDFEG